MQRHLFDARVGVEGGGGGAVEEGDERTVLFGQDAHVFDGPKLDQVEQLVHRCVGGQVAHVDGAVERVDLARHGREHADVGHKAGRGAKVGAKVGEHGCGWIQAVRTGEQEGSGGGSSSSSSRIEGLAILCADEVGVTEVAREGACAVGAVAWWLQTGHGGERLRLRLRAGGGAVGEEWRLSSCARRKVGKVVLGEAGDVAFRDEARFLGGGSGSGSSGGVGHLRIGDGAEMTEASVCVVGLGGGALHHLERIERKAGRRRRRVGRCGGRVAVGGKGVGSR